MGNSGLRRFLPLLNRWAKSDEPEHSAALREAARWAISRLSKA